jgi:hypothetical protein
MSAVFASAYLGEKSMAQTVKSLRSSRRTSQKELGILHDIIIHHGDTELALNFHVFEIQDFNILIGHPLEKFIVEFPSSGALDIKLERDIFTIPIT